MANVGKHVLNLICTPSTLDPGVWMIHVHQFQYLAFSGLARPFDELQYMHYNEIFSNMLFYVAFHYFFFPVNLYFHPQKGIAISDVTLVGENNFCNFIQ